MRDNTLSRRVYRDLSTSRPQKRVQIKVRVDEWSPVGPVYVFSLRQGNTRENFFSVRLQQTWKKDLYEQKLVQPQIPLLFSIRFLAIRYCCCEDFSEGPKVGRSWASHFSEVPRSGL